MRNVRLYNTLSRTKEIFNPLEKGIVKMYHCGPTVYDFQHIGNLFAAQFSDVLRRSFEYIGFEVVQVMNITDVGHITDNNEVGEDKMEKGARKAGKTVWEIADFFTNQYLADTRELNILEPHYRPKATEHIQEMIEMIEVLIDSGYAYTTPTAVYFDVSKFENYTKLSNQKLEENIQKSRQEIVEDSSKRNWYDFRLWQLDQPSHSMQWESPWGKGFPGWHIECSAMSKKYLGKSFDIHTGGIEHIPVHHTNEIAQSESANQSKYVNYWLHHQHILVEGEKMSKSLGNVFLLKDLEEKGFEPLALRLLYLQSKYREQLNFTFESLTASQNSLQNIVKNIENILRELQKKDIKIDIIPQKKENKFQDDFENAISDDLNTSEALAVFFGLLKDKDIDPQDKLEQLLSFDQVLGLSLTEIKIEEESEEIKNLKKDWQEAREKKDWSLADSLRDKIVEMGGSLN